MVIQNRKKYIDRTITVLFYIISLTIQFSIGAGNYMMIFCLSPFFWDFGEKRYEKSGRIRLYLGPVSFYLIRQTPSKG